MRKNIFISLILLIFIAVALVIASLVQKTMAASSPSSPFPTEWPPFTMVYEDWRLGSNIEQPTIQVVKITYQDRKHWRTELLDHNLAKDAIGTWSEYNGEGMIGYDPRTGEVSISPQDFPKEGVYIPEQWLIPRYIPKLLTQENVELLEESDGLATVLVTEYWPCQEPTDVMLQAGIKPCDTDNRRDERLISYRTADFLPVLIIDKLDGVEVHRVTIKELVIDKSIE
jgi:hypothetical protein